LLHREGGAILHAASVELDGAIVAFVGPSGAGKSTACRHVAGATLFSVDRLAVRPAPGLPEPMWVAHPLPGGTRSPADLASSAEGWRPLAGALRVHQAAEGAHIRSVGTAAAVALLRQSAFQIGAEPAAETELLASLERLATHVPVARLELALGASLTGELRRWLVDQTRDRA
jgi:energy-coupling factor transporter ATP-binding protein EcfA2